MADVLPALEVLNVQRTLRDWMNTCPILPYNLSVTFEDLPANEVGICIATNQSPKYLAKYILGGYRAQYEFSVILRVLPSGDGDMLDAVEALARVAAWAAKEPAPVITGAVNVQIKQTSDVAVQNVYEDMTADYAVTMSLTWEVFDNG